jgi:hypothetical protein
LSKPTKRLFLVELNEINFDVVASYLKNSPKLFPSLKKLLLGQRIRTRSEQMYEELEPWIQWVSVHTNKTYSEHQIFRLGDIVGSETPQILEKIEEAGFKVGSICAMNAENRLKNPCYFIPDPWTRTPPDSSWWSRSLTQAISQAVNDNANAKISLRSFIIIAIGFLRFAHLKNYAKYMMYILAGNKRPWMKAMILDLLLHDIHWRLSRKKKTDFSILFLNAGAHIQHHYFFNAAPLRNQINRNPSWYVRENEDPLADLLKLYDFIVGEYLGRSDAEIIFATGLSQKPYDRIKFYYRLKSHSKFLHNLGIQFTSVEPRMTRDFLVNFENDQQAKNAQEILAGIHIEGDNIPLFDEIDNRGNSLFVTLTYPKEITPLTRYCVGKYSASLLGEVSFVAIKNGMHQAEGFAFFTSGIAKYAPVDKAHVASLGKTVMNYFEVVNK